MGQKFNLTVIVNIVILKCYEQLDKIHDIFIQFAIVCESFTKLLNV